MPIKVYYKNKEDEPCTIRPTPFVSVSENILKNKEGNFGVTYSITLTGTLLAKFGTPYASDPANPISDPLFLAFDNQTVASHVGNTIGPYKSFDKVALSSNSYYKPVKQKITGTAPNSSNILVDKSAAALLSKQRALRALFAEDGQKVEISDILDNAGATVICFPRVVSVDFTEGNYVNKCEYTIVLEADFLVRGNFTSDSELAGAYVDYADTFVNHDPNFALKKETTTLQELLDSKYTAFIEDYTESWNLEADDAQAETDVNHRTYRISHSLTATGKRTGHAPATAPSMENVYVDPEKDSAGLPTSQTVSPAWVQAKKFCLTKINNGNPSGTYPNFYGQLGSGTLDLIDSYQGYNHVRTESVDVTAGTYSITENWLLASGTSYENFSMSTSTSNTDPFINVNIDGNIKGLNNLPPFYGKGAHPSGSQGDPKLNSISGAFVHAMDKYNLLTNSGQFGLTSDLYKRANNLVAVPLNSQPTSINLQTNPINGEISYSLGFNNRPTNIISGVIAESIQVNDTYPGDIFAVLPVLGRATGPILQYVGGRTEYKRDVSINLTMDYTKIPYGKERNPLLLKKPSVVNPTANQLAQLVNELSPAGEPGVRKYFISPPTESWSPKEGSYSFNISWTYELDR